MHRRLLVVVGLVILASVVGLGLSGIPPAGAEDPSSLAQTEPEGFDDTVFEIRLFSNGDARWTVVHSRPLENETDVDEFETFAEQFRTEELDAYQQFQVRAARLTAQGSNVTDREMTATEFQRDAYVDELGQRSAVVEMSFRWTNFAPVDNGTVVVGDLFAGGFAITDGQRLRLSTEDGLAFSSVSPEPDSVTVEDDLTASSSVTWFGERQFADNRPRAELVPPAQLESGADDSTTDGSTGDGTGDGETTDGTGDTAQTGDDDSSADTPGTDENASGMGMAPFAVGGILVLLGLGGGLALYATRTDETTADEPAPEMPETTESTASPETGPAPTEEELLTDEDRVLNLLEDHDGRMKQVDIVEQTDWSKSKVSMLLSDMEEEGDITKLRVGRENIISLAGEEPDAAGSPFDEE